MAIVSELLVAVGADISGARDGLATVDRGIESVARSADGAAPRFNALQEVVVGGLRYMGEVALQTGLAIGGALARAGGEALDSAANYQQSMAVLQQASSASASEMAALGQLAQQLGSDVSLPGTSALDASQAMLELVKAGVSVNDTLEATRGVLQLSAAAGVDNATAAAITAGALNTFGLAGEDATRVADMLAAAANASSASMTDLADGIKQGGFAFDAAGMPLEDLTTAVAALANVGLTGSDAGTALKNAIMRLFDPTKEARGVMSELGLEFYNLDGTMKQLPEIIDVLNTGLAGLTDEQRNQALSTIFLSDGMKALLPLLDLGSEGFADLKEQVTAQGAAGETAAAMNSGLRGALDGLSSALETLGLVAAQPLLEPAERGVRSLTDAIALAQPAILDLINDVIVPGATAALNFADAFLAAPDKLGFFANILTDVGARARDALMGALGGGGNFFGGLIATVQAQLPQWIAALEPYAQEAGAWLIRGISYLGEHLLEWRNNLVEFVLSSLPGWMSALEPYAAALGNWVLEALPGLINNIGTATTELIGIIGTYAPAIIDKLGEWAMGFAEWVLEAAPGLLANIGTVVGNILDAIGTYAPPLIEKLATWAAAFIGFAVEKLPDILAGLGEVLVSIGNWIVERAPAIGEKLGEWAIAFVSWAIPLGADLVGKLGAALGEMLTWIFDNRGQISTTLAEWGTAFGEWIMRDAWPAVQTELGKLWESIKGWFTETFTAIGAEGSIGRLLWDSFMSGGTNGLMNELTGGVLGNIGVPGFAGGVSNFGGGLAIVGERGPELVNLPGGSDVIPNNALGGLVGSVTNVYVTVTGNVTTERDLSEAVRLYLEEYDRRNG